MWQALAPSRDRLDRALTLVFLRQLLDPTMPKLAGNDPRALLSGSPTWERVIAADTRARWFDSLTGRLNELLGEPLLSGGWQTLGAEVTERAVIELSAWVPEPYSTGGDVLGDALQQLRGDTGHGAFYTPYNISLGMAMVLMPRPGERISDPACGSGRMLLASLQACRQMHNGGEPDLYGVDLDEDAVRVCALNLVLAGYGASKAVAATQANARVLEPSARPSEAGAGRA
jgi:hypothetical protein